MAILVPTEADVQQCKDRLSKALGQAAFPQNVRLPLPHGLVHSRVRREKNHPPAELPGNVPRVIKSFLKRVDVKKNCAEMVALMTQKVEAVEQDKAAWFAVDWSAVKAVDGRSLVSGVAGKMNLRHTALIFSSNEKLQVRPIADSELLELKGWPQCLNTSLSSGACTQTALRLAEAKYIAAAVKSLYM